jgi:hypothetical protein
MTDAASGSEGLRGGHLLLAGETGMCPVPVGIYRGPPWPVPRD